MRSILPAETLAKLFTMVIDATIDGLPAGEPYQIRIEEDDSNYYLLVIAEDCSFVEDLLENHELFDSPQVTTCLIEETKLPCFGLICRNHDPEQAREVWYLIERRLDQKKSYISR